MKNGQPACFARILNVRQTSETAMDKNLESVKLVILLRRCAEILADGANVAT